jgi:transcriptional modulator of mazE/toxin, mazF
VREIRRTEIYYADLNPVKGSEQGGLRPVLILQNDIGNRHSPTTIVAAITSRRSKAKMPTHVKIFAEGLPQDSIVLLEQIRTIDKTRLTEYVCRVNRKTMGKINRAIKVSLTAYGIRLKEGINNKIRVGFVGKPVSNNFT